MPKRKWRKYLKLLAKVKYYVKILDVIVYYRLRGGAKSDMPNIKSAKKRVKVIEKKTLRNNMIKSGYKSAVRKFEEAIEAGNIEEAKTLFSQATKNRSSLHKRCYS